MFEKLDANSVAAIIKKCGPLKPMTDANSSSSISDAIEPIRLLAKFVTHNGKKPFAQDLERIAIWLLAYQTADMDEFVRVAEAAYHFEPPKTRKAKTAVADTVNKYLQRLDETYGFETGFDEVYDELKSDPSMKAVQLKKLAKLFAKASTKSREEALSAIYGKHSNIVEADRHAAARGGRVA